MWGSPIIGTSQDDPDAPVPPPLIMPSSNSWLCGDIIGDIVVAGDGDGQPVVGGMINFSDPLSVLNKH